MLPIITTLTSIPVSAATCKTGFAERLDGADDLTLRGKGTARYLLFKVYDAALYAPATIEIATAPRLCLEICYHRELEPSVLITAADQLLARQNSPERLERLNPHIERLHAAYRGVAPNDRYRLCRAAGRLALALNGAPLTTVEDEEFAAAYLDIWLGDPPLSAALRDALLANDDVPAESTGRSR